MGARQIWRILPEAYEAIRAPPVAAGFTDAETASTAPVTIFGVSLNRNLAAEMGAWCEESGIPARVVETPTVQFVELYDALHAVLFKIRWV